MPDNYLNLTGLSRFLDKIKAWVNAKIATDSDYGMVKLNPSESVDVNANGQLMIGGRLGQYPGGGGLYYPTTIQPENVAPNSLLPSSFPAVFSSPRGGRLPMQP